jgi:hypothetical protein
VPYASLGILGFLIYRGCKKNAEYFQKQAQNQPPDDPTSDPSGPTRE